MKRRMILRSLMLPLVMAISYSAISVSFGIELRLTVALMLLWLVLIGLGSVITVNRTLNMLGASENDDHLNEPTIIKTLFRLLLPSYNERENIIGDLLEEFNEFPSRPKAYLWLYKQVLMSALPFIYESLKIRLAAYFGKRIR